MSTDGMTTMAGATEFAHMLLKVSDLNRSERFYVDLLGFKVRAAKPLADGRPFLPFTQGIALTVGGPKASPQMRWGTSSVRKSGTSSPTMTRQATSIWHRLMIFREDRVPVA